jgi:1-acyl-sn-glycerol-3-phosphate acyltransferase
MNLLWRGWRTLATVLCFACLAIGAMLLGALCIPVVWLLWRRNEARHRMGRFIVHTGLRVFVLLMRGTGVLHVRYERLDGLGSSGNLVLANHPTLIDFIVLAAVIPQSDCIFKSSLLNDWCNRWPLLLAGYIRNDEAESTLARCRQSLDHGNTLIIFPEGTRSSPGKPVKFHKGAAQVAVRIHQDVTPILITCTSSNLHKGGAWYLAPEHQVRMTLCVHDPIRVDPFLQAHDGQPRLAARDLNDHLQLFFNQGLMHAGS